MYECSVVPPTVPLSYMFGVSVVPCKHDCYNAWSISAQFLYLLWRSRPIWHGLGPYNSTPTTVYLFWQYFTEGWRFAPACLTFQTQHPYRETYHLWVLYSATVATVLQEMMMMPSGDRDFSRKLMNKAGTKFGRCHPVQYKLVSQVQGFRLTQHWFEYFIQ
jgi:hypothetical protein